MAGTGQDVLGLPAAPDHAAATGRDRGRWRPAWARRPTSRAGARRRRVARAAVRARRGPTAPVARAARSSTGGSRTAALSRIVRRHGGATSSRRRAVISPARPETSGSSMRRGRSMSTANSATTRPGRLDSSTTRSARRAASRTLWVTNTTVKPAILPESLELVVEQVAGHGVEGAEGLVHQQDVGVLGEGPGEGDALAHAARQLVGALVGEAREVHQSRAARRPGRVAPAGRTPRSLRASSTFPPTVSHGNSAASWNISAVRPGDVDLAAGGGVEPGDQVEQRALAAAGGPDQADELAGAHSSGRRGRGRGRAVGPVTVDLGHVAAVTPRPAPTGGASGTSTATLMTPVSVGLALRLQQDC